METNGNPTVNQYFHWLNDAPVDDSELRRVIDALLNDPPDGLDVILSDRGTDVNQHSMAPTKDYYNSGISHYTPPPPPPTNPHVSASGLAVEKADNALSQAAQALEAASSRPKGDSKGGFGKLCASQVLTAATLVVNALDPIASMHPATQVLFSVFRAVIKLEGQREEAQLEITAIMFTMTATVHQVQAAQPIFAMQDDPNLKAPLEDIVKRISTVIEKFGNFTNLYYKSKAKITHLLRSGDNKSKLADYKSEFLLIKEELKTYLEICHIKLSSSISDKVDTATSKLDKILERLDSNEEDKQFWNYVNANGGAGGVIGNDELLKNAAALLNEQLSGTMVSEMRTEIGDLLEKNKTEFEATVSASVGNAVIDSLRQLERERADAEKEQRFICIQCDKEYRNSTNGPKSCSFHKYEYNSWGKSWPCCDSGNPCQSNSHRFKHHSQYPYSNFFIRARDILGYTNTVDKWTFIEDANLENKDLSQTAMIGKLLRWKHNASRIDEPTIIIQVGRVVQNSPYFFDTFTTKELELISRNIARTRQNAIFRTSSDMQNFSLAEWIFSSGRITGVRLTVKSATSERPYIHVCPIDMTTCSKSGDVLVESSGGFLSYTPDKPYTIPETIVVGPKLIETPPRAVRKDFKVVTSPALPILIKITSDPHLQANPGYYNLARSVDYFEGVASIFNKKIPDPANGITIDSITALFRLVGEDTYRSVSKIETPDITFPITIEPRQTLSVKFKVEIPRTEEDKKAGVGWQYRSYVSRFNPLRLKLVVTDIEGEEASLVVEHINPQDKYEQEQKDDLAFFALDDWEQFDRIGGVHIKPADNPESVIKIGSSDVAVDLLQEIVFRAIKTGETEIAMPSASSYSSNYWRRDTYALVDTSCRRVYAFKIHLQSDNKKAACLGYVPCPSYGDVMDEVRSITYAREKVRISEEIVPFEPPVMVDDDKVDDFVAPTSSAPAGHGLVGSSGPGSGAGGSQMVLVPAELINRLTTLDANVNRLATAVDKLLVVDSGINRLAGAVERLVTILERK